MRPELRNLAADVSGLPSRPPLRKAALVSTAASRIGIASTRSIIVTENRKSDYRLYHLLKFSGMDYGQNIIILPTQSCRKSLNTRTSHINKVAKTDIDFPMVTAAAH
jgi:hypothetical protein